MSIIREEDFHPTYPDYCNDQSVPPHKRLELILQSSSITSAAFCDLSEVCFHCREPITTLPIVYWSGSLEVGLTLHPQCAGRLAAGLMRDYMEFRDGADEAWKWIKAFKPSMPETLVTNQ